MSFEIEPWFEKIILKQERRLRREYEGEYLYECKEKGIPPLPYAAWRHGRAEPRILEMLMEETRINESGELKVI